MGPALPGATFTWIRGNVQTRVQRVREGRLREAPLHGTLLAAAGLRRLGLDLSDLDVRPLDPAQLLPAPAQGALLAEIRAGEGEALKALLRAFHDETTARCVGAERAVLAGLGGGCQQPLGALALPEAGGGIFLSAAFAGPDGIRRAEARGLDDASVVRAVLQGLAGSPS
jgi:hydroxymethylbilane synthase